MKNVLFFLNQFYYTSWTNKASFIIIFLITTFVCSSKLHIINLNLICNGVDECLFSLTLYSIFAIALHTIAHFQRLANSIQTISFSRCSLFYLYTYNINNCINFRDQAIWLIRYHLTKQIKSISNAHTHTTKTNPAVLVNSLLNSESIFTLNTNPYKIVQS